MPKTHPHQPPSILHKVDKVSLSSVKTMSILLWRWLVKLCFLQNAAIALAPSILPLSRHRHHQQESSSSSSSASISVAARTRRFPAFVLTTAGLLEPRRDLRTILGTRTEAVDEYVEAEDLDGLQELFNRYCDQEGLMTKSATKQIPAIAELLEDLLPSEFDTIWRTVDKFPETDEPKKKTKQQSKQKRASAVTKATSTTKEQEERIDVDSFVKLYRAIDDLFENVDNAEAVVLSEPTAKVNGMTAPVAKTPAPATGNKNSAVAVSDDDDDGEEDPVMEEELESIFQQLCDAGGLLNKTALRAWDEVAALFNDGLLGQDEFDRLWDETRKSPGTVDKLDEQGFLSFNVALDDLFDFEDDDSDDDEDDDDDAAASVVAESPPVSTPESFDPRMVAGDDLPPDVLFIALANEDGLVGRSELSRWSELQEMLQSGDLLQSELDAIFARATKSEKHLNKLEEKGFTEMFQAIDDLFEKDDDGGDLAAAGGLSSTDTAPSSAKADSIKKELYNAINALNDDDLLPCGLDALDSEQKEILAIVDRLEKIPTNFVRARKGNIGLGDLSGTWELLYSSSSAMKFNKGLTGLGGSFPNGKFSTLKQKLMLTKFMSDVEYTEHIAVKPSAASFDVTVTGSWEIRKSISIFTGDTTIILAVEPDRVSYGPTSTRADHWKSLGPMNYLDLIYLDDDLRIMRGNTSINTIFVLQRCAS